MRGKILTSENIEEAKKYIGKEVIFFTNEVSKRSSYFKGFLLKVRVTKYNFVLDKRRKFSIVEKRSKIKIDKKYLFDNYINCFEKILIPEIKDKNGNYLLEF